MSGRGVVELGDLIGRVERLEIECARCFRRGRYRVSGLVERHGPGFDMGQLAAFLTADCPGAAAQHWSDRCDLRFPQLQGLAAKDQPDVP